MKNTIAILPLILAMFVASFAVRAADTNYVGDVETLAQGFLLHAADHYVAQFNARAQSNGITTYISIHAVMNSDLFITNMQVNDKDIPLPKPIAGISIPDDGYMGVNLDLFAYDKGGTLAAQGRFYTNYLAKGSGISITMLPEFPPVSIAIPTPAPDQIKVLLSGADGWSWYYDQITGSVVIQTYGSGPDVLYVITDNKGNTLAHGKLPFFQKPSLSVDQPSVINPLYAGNYRSMSLGTNGYSYLDGLQFDTWVTRSNTLVLTKVIGVPDIGNLSKLYVYANNIPAGTIIEIRKWASSGPMTLVPSTTTVSPYGDLQVLTSQYLDKAVVTVIPPPGKATTKDGFTIQVSRGY